MSVVPAARRHPASHLLAFTNVGGHENTGRDLVADLLGAAAAGWWVSRRRPSRPVGGGSA